MNQELQITSASSAGAMEQGCVSSGAHPSAPSLLPLDRPVESRKSNNKLPFKDAGRDFHEPHIEVVTLSALLNSQSVAQNFTALLDAEDFYDPTNRVLLAAFLYLFNEDGAVSREALESYLAETVNDFGEDWQSYIDRCMATAFNAKDVDRYVIRLKRASQIRGGDGHCLWKFSEPFCVDRLRANMPPTKCVGKEWFQYTNGGSWSSKDKNMVRRVAWESISPNHRQAKRVSDVIDHTESALQVPKDTFGGAYKLSDGQVLINVANGVVVVSADGSMELQPHDPEHYFTAKLAAEYAPEAQCPLFDQTLEQALPDQEDRVLLQRFTGYILFPGCHYEVALVCYGKSGTSKSTVVLCFRNVLGDEICGSAGMEELCKSSSYSLPGLKHKMLNLCSELCGKEIEESSNFKQLVSGEYLTVRPIFGAPWEMQTTCKLLFLSNNMPRFRSGTDAEARRLRILHFNQEPKQKNPDLKEALKKESSGVLNWMLRGLAELLQQRTIPEGGEASKRLLKTFNRSNDPVGSFINEMCEFGPSFKEAKRTLLEAFNEWCMEGGMSSEKMENFFFKTIKSRYPDLKDARPFVNGKRERCFLGIGLKEECSDDSPERPIISPFMLEKLKLKAT